MIIFTYKTINEELLELDGTIYKPINSYSRDGIFSNDPVFLKNLNHFYEDIEAVIDEDRIEDEQSIFYVPHTMSNQFIEAFKKIFKLDWTERKTLTDKERSYGMDFLIDPFRKAMEIVGILELKKVECSNKELEELLEHDIVNKHTLINAAFVYSSDSKMFCKYIDNIKDKELIIKGINSKYFDQLKNINKDFICFGEVSKHHKLEYGGLFSFSKGFLVLYFLGNIEQPSVIGFISVKHDGYALLLRQCELAVSKVDEFLVLKL